MGITMKRVAILAAALSLPLAPAWAEPAPFDTPDAAAEAVIEALTARDRDAVVTIFGPENEDIIFSGDDEADAANFKDFVQSYNQMHRIAVEDDLATLYIGFEQWPAPIPIMRGSDGAWRFDPEAARDEITARRIGENELDVIEMLRAYVRVQAAYRQIDYDGDGVMEFANAILSDAGERNGLYWPDEPGIPESPIGEFVARASSQGYSIGAEAEDPDPYRGYYFRILTEQGPDAPGGAHGYLVGDNLVGGHAIIAFPSAHGETGIMTLLVGENGIVYEADLGENTLEAAAEIDAYNPDDRWDIVE